MTIPMTKDYEDVSGIISGKRYSSSMVCDDSKPSLTINTSWLRHSYSRMVRQRPKPKKLLPTPAIFSEYRVMTDTSYSCKRLSPTSTASGQGGYRAAHSQSATDPVDIIPSEGCKNSTINKALNRLNENGASFGESIATFRQTGNMVARRAFQLAELALAVRTGKWSKIGDIIKGSVPGSLKRIPASRRLADGWLELEFGWKPLIEDVYTGINLYRNKLVEGQLANSRANCVIGGFGPKEQSFENNMIRMNTYGANTSVKIYAVVGNSTIATLNDMGLVNPALIGWQLLPFSFVVDWFLPVSTILSSMTAKAGYDVEAACIVSETLKGRVMRENPTVPSAITRTVTRDVTFDVHSHFSIDTAYRAHSIWHVGTAVALLRQMFGR